MTMRLGNLGGDEGGSPGDTAEGDQEKAARAVVNARNADGAPALVTESAGACSYYSVSTAGPVCKSGSLRLYHIWLYHLVFIVHVHFRLVSGVCGKFLVFACVSGTF